MAVAEETKPEERETTAIATTTANESSTSMAAMNRKLKRKALKKMKRKQLRREKALKEREEEEARLNDPEVQMRLLRLEREENERMEKDRREFEDREKQFVMELERKMKERDLEEEAERSRKVDDRLAKDLVDNEKTNGLHEDDNEWEYVEEGPAEIIWKGNEIIVKKKKVRVPKKGPALPKEKQESERPISNPLAPQSEAYEDYRSAQEVLESVAQQVPNFGTEQDKAHCPFNLKTGVCRFGARCSRVHFYPDKSCTLLMKNMYNGPGLAYEQDEGLEHTDEEVERSFEDFYEDVHTEFLKFGEIVNFKVCKNASSHLRGNVYVHYRQLDSAVLAYQSINGRFFAGKQISCEFVNLTKWKVAICGEYMKSRFKTCSRGSACNFIHCFRNPGGDYEWADLDKPAPRYWLKKMASLFGCATDRFSDECSPGSHHSRRSRSRGSDNDNFSDEDDDRRRGYPRKRRVYDRGVSYHHEDIFEDRRSSYDYDRTKYRKSVNSDISERDNNDSKISADTTRSSRKRERDSGLTRRGSKSRRDGNYSDRRGCSKEPESGRYREHTTGSSGSGKDYNSDLKENHNVDMCGDKHINKGRDSLPRRKKEKSLDINSDEDRLDRDEDRYHRHSKKSSRKSKKEAKLSDRDSHGGSIFEVEKNYRKDRKKVSRSKSEIADVDSDKEKLEKEEEHRRHRRKNSKYHSKDKFTKADYDAYRCSVDRDKPNEKEEEKDLHSYRSLARHKNHHANLDENQSEDKVDGISETSSFHEDNLCRYSEEDKFHDSRTEDQKSYREGRSQTSDESNERNASSHEVEATDRNFSSQDSYRQSETQIEQAYRLAALKKLEELKRSKDTSVKYREQDETMVIDSCDRENLLRSTEVGRGSSKVDRTAASVKRRRI